MTFTEIAGCEEHWALADISNSVLLTKIKNHVSRVWESAVPSLKQSYKRFTR